MNRLICDLCYRDIIVDMSNGRAVWNGCDYLKVRVEKANSLPLPDDEPQDLSICPYCARTIIKKSLKRRKMGSLLGEFDKK